MFSFIKKNKYQITKFFFIGLLSSLINFLVYFLLYKINFNINVASSAGYLVGLFNSFIFSKIWVFGNLKFKRLNNDLIIFTLIYFFGGIEMTLTINFVISLIDNFQLAWFCGAAIAATNNYLGSRWLFKN